jgi:maltose-binding protein MalE
VAGKYIMLPNSTTGDKLTTASAFIKFLTTDEETVLSYTVSNGRLPALLSALQNEKVTSDPILKQTSAVLVTGVAQPVQAEIRCVFDGVTTSIRALNSGAESDAKKLADEAQKAAEDCISKLG